MQLAFVRDYGERTGNFIGPELPDNLGEGIEENSTNNFEPVRVFAWQLDQLIGERLVLNGLTEEVHDPHAVTRSLVLLC
ncbi:hypothetical protein C0L86_23735 [Streptomyces sp. SCA2-2]|nr:hypothetical protein C0L86_23735 [Streptomyces sp. SCA2-2]